MAYSIPPELFTMLAQAKAQAPEWSRDLNAGGEALGSIAGAVKGYQGQQRQKKLDSFFDTSVPNTTLQRVIPGAPADGSINYRDLAGLAGSGLTSVLKDPNSATDLKSLAILASGGDSDKAGKLFKMFSTNADGTPAGPMQLNPATIAAAKALRPPKPATPRGSASPEVQTLKALQNQYSKQLGEDVSEADHSRIQKNLDAVNSRLARLGGVTIDNSPAPATPPSAAPATTTAAPAAKPSSTSSVVQALLKALSQ